jgi:hypothetical protein
MRRNYMSINKKLLFLIYLIGICASCTKEDVTRREEGDLTIVPVWGDYIKGNLFPPEVKYYLYNLDNISISPIIITDSKGEGFTRRLPVGTYRLIGYNKTDASKNIKFDYSKPFTVVAKISQDDFNPLDLYIVSCDNILIKDNDAITKEIVPIEVKAKTLSLKFSFDNELNSLYPYPFKGEIKGISTSINLLNGEAFEDKNFISFEVKSDLITLRTSGLLYSTDSRNDELIPPVLSLTLGEGTDSYTGDASLKETIEELNASPQKTDNITLNVTVRKYTQYKENPKRIQITPTIYKKN